MALYTRVDLWHYNSTDGRNIQNTLDFLLPYIIGKKPWPYQQIVPFGIFIFFFLFF